ncbi:MAG TPA: hypothetical protein PKH33_03650 [bacterium]|nr:hypothetical protein [bacterium]
MSSRILWPEINKDIAPERTPATILKEQAEALSAITGSTLKGKVNHFPAILTRDKRIKFLVVGSWDTKKSDSLSGHVLLIIAPKLNNYEIPILNIAYHPLNTYPVYITSDMMVNAGEMEKEAILQSDSEEEFVDLLKSILSSDRVNRIIHSLIAQSKDPDPLYVDQDDPF